MKVASIVGTRPQFVKEAALSPSLRSRHDEVLINTGQHYDRELCAEQFDALEIPEPDYDLDVGSGSHARQTAAMMVGLEDVLRKVRPRLVLVYGDTNSTLAGALSASKLGLPVAHVEAGPRQFDMGIPEEINRVVTDRLSRLLFAPTARSAENLEREGIVRGVHVTGDVMYDIFLEAEARARAGHVLERYELEPGGYILMTLHRPHNSDDPSSLGAIIEGARSAPETLLFPVHPRTRANLERFGMLEELEKDPAVLLVKPVHYLDMVALTGSARAVLTDSGGVNKEAYFCGVPCVCFDRVSAWPETVEAGWCEVTGADARLIARALSSVAPGPPRPPLFGDGRASEKIVELITVFGSTA